MHVIGIHGLATGLMHPIGGRHSCEKSLAHMVAVKVQPAKLEGEQPLLRAAPHTHPPLPFPPTRRRVLDEFG